MSTATAPVKLEIWSDVVCSWCYVGKRHLETALAGIPDRDQVTVRWRSFELDPTLAADAGGADEELARRRGISLAEARAMHEQTERMGEQLGIRFDFARARRGNTFDAHRLLHMAAEQGRQHQLLDRLMPAYFAEGVPIGERPALTAVAVAAGMDGDAVAAMLAGDGFAEAVRADEQEAAMLGITAVPFFVVDRRYGLPGAHPPETIRAAIDRARLEASPV